MTRPPESPTMPPLEALAVRSSSLSEHALACLRVLILDRRIELRCILPEEKIADDLGISRTPMCEALGRLARGWSPEDGRRSQPSA